MAHANTQDINPEKVLSSFCIIVMARQFVPRALQLNNNLTDSQMRAPILYEFSKSKLLELSSSFSLLGHPDQGNCSVNLDFFCYMKSFIISKIHMGVVSRKKMCNFSSSVAVMPYFLIDPLASVAHIVHGHLPDIR